MWSTLCTHCCIYLHPNSPMRIAFFGLLTLAYPLLVFFGLSHFEPRWLAILLVIVAIARAYATRDLAWLAAAIGAAILALAGAFTNNALPLKLYPVLVSLVFLCVFAFSLRFPPTVIERLARLQEPNFTASGVRYTRRVTQVWCAFFILNACISIVTAVWASNAIWVLYNGFISYLLMGALFVCEWLVRRRVRARIVHSHI